jgi:ethanolamine ammonia-lyase small subunit
VKELDTFAPDRWQMLRELTAARIALGRAGASLPTQAQLDFQWAHARARDAVYHPLDMNLVKAQIDALSLEVCSLTSAATDRQTYLKRPDLGRVLNDESRDKIIARAALLADPVDLVIVVADGLSAQAIERNAAKMLRALLPALKDNAISLAPICLVQQARVAIGDEIGEILHAQMVAIMIGERPGLSSPDSMGIYLSWQPKVGLLDAARNCLSNIRPQGMSIDVALEKLMYLLTQAKERKLTGVSLKDETALGPVPKVGQATRFIL